MKIRRAVVSAAMIVTGCGEGRDSGSDSLPVARTGAEDFIFVDDDGSDVDGDGSWHSPLASVRAGVELFREEGAARAISIQPGTYRENLSLWGTAADGIGLDDGLTIVGAGAGEVVLEAGDDTQPIVKVSGVRGFSLSGLTLRGGRRALWVWQGSNGDVRDVTIAESERLGVIMDGSETVVLEDVEIRDTIRDVDGLGYGMSLQNSTVEMIGGGVWDAWTIGILVDQGQLTADNVTVSHIEADEDDGVGRGIQLQRLATGHIKGGEISDCRDAGIFALGTLTLDVNGAWIGDIEGAAIPETAESSGDGLVAASGDPKLDPSLFKVGVTHTTVQGVERAAMVFDGVAVTALGDNLLSDSGFPLGGVWPVVQGETDMTGIDASLYYEHETGLALNLQVLAIDLQLP